MSKGTVHSPEKVPQTVGSRVVGLLLFGGGYSVLTNPHFRVYNNDCKSYLRSYSRIAEISYDEFNRGAEGGLRQLLDLFQFVIMLCAVITVVVVARKK